jgi:hypothetical protein
MTKEELEKSLYDAQVERDLLKEKLREIERNRRRERSETKNSGSNAEDVEAATIAEMTKYALRDAIENGNLQMFLEKILGSLDFAKTAISSLSEIIEKAQAKMDGKNEEIVGADGMSFASDMWLPMLMGIVQTQEFQHLMANMIVKMIKDL